MTRPIPQDIAEQKFDVIIIGAGINGSGVARDSAMRNLRVLLLDKGDIGSGTSSFSSRLIHGGLRYLEFGEFGLVRESLRERECLLRIAPHLVKPLPLLIPIYESNSRGRLAIRLGMIAYDLLSIGKSLPRHRVLSRKQALAAAPGLNPQGLKAAAVYYDAQVEFAERLVIENVIAARDAGATVLTYCRVNKLIVEDGTVNGVKFTDSLNSGEYVARASIVINASGPWVDDVLSSEDSKPERLIGGTVGSHLIVNAIEGAPASALYVEAAEDGRPFFIIPWNGKCLIGTTDKRFDGDLDQLEASDDEVDYLLNETNRVFPAAKLSRKEVLFTYSGVRPLPFVTNKAETGITRRHFIQNHGAPLRNLYSIIGGKLTTYRNLSEQAVDLVMKKLNKPFVKSRTSDRRLPGADSIDFEKFSDYFRKENEQFDPQLLDRLLRIYGVRSTEVLNLAKADPNLTGKFDLETGAIAAEIVFAFRDEMAETICDCLLRRTMVGLNSSVGLNSVEDAAQVARNYLGWNEDRASHEVASYGEYVKRFAARD